MATTISLTDARSAAIALGGARSVNIQNLEAAAALVTVEGSNDGAIYSAIGVVNIPAEGAQVVNTQGFSLLYLTLPTGETGDVAVNPFDRAASSEVVQEVALNATPPTIDSGAGGIVSVTGSTGSTTLKFPAVPYSGQRITLLNKTTAAYTLSGNGYNINGASTLSVPAGGWARSFTFDGVAWQGAAVDYGSGVWPFSRVIVGSMTDDGVSLLQVAGQGVFGPPTSGQLKLVPGAIPYLISYNPQTAAYSPFQLYSSTFQVAPNSSGIRFVVDSSGSLFMSSVGSNVLYVGESAITTYVQMTVDGTLVVNGNHIVTTAGGSTGGTYYRNTTTNYSRWFAGKVTGAESGANAGSDFAILRYADDGSYLGIPLTISRATGEVTLANRLKTAASTTAEASLNIPSGTAPTSPANGDLWFDGTNLKLRVSGTTYTITKS